MTTKGIMKKIIYLLFTQCFAWNLYATDNLTLPHQFQGGSRISASAINENFQTIVDYLNQLTEGDLRPNTTPKIFAIADTTLYISNDYVNFVDIINDCGDCPTSKADLTFVGNKYFIGGSAKFFTSDNGLIWKRFDLDATKFKFNNGKYYGYGKKFIFESLDAENWTQVDSYGEYIEKIIFGNGITMGLIERSSVIYTKSGSLGYLTKNFTNPLDIIFHKNYFVISDSYEVNSNKSNARIQISSNGYEWESIFDQAVNGQSTYLNKLYSFDDLLIAAGSPYPIYTTDLGTSWEILEFNTYDVVQFKNNIYFAGHINDIWGIYLLNQSNFQLELKLNANVYFLDSNSSVMVASGEGSFYSTVDGTNYKQANTFSLTNAITKTLLVE